jgi:hypothetical protein
MRSIKQTIKCPIQGYESLELTYEINYRAEQLRIWRRGTNFCPALLDIPNWENVAGLLELFEIDQETGELTDTPMAKPAFPLSVQTLDRLPDVLMVGLMGDTLMNRASQEYTRAEHPNSNGASLDI